MYGSYAPCYSDQQMIAFKRSAEGSPSFVIALNLSHRPCYYKQSGISGKIIVSTYPESEGLTVNEHIDLSGDEGVIVRID